MSTKLSAFGNKHKSSNKKRISANKLSAICATANAPSGLLVENSNDFIVRFDSGLRHLFVNRAVVESTGTAFEDYIGKNQ
jgi:PAS domain-containing protein